ncbi:hypothetical protein PG991_001096 [Apiospora marii]|uniref:Uncharacterized protein n=1 Tax=Apiospora marii TaxID=335849 RepID=A0ABR1STU2_9PEZI
MQLTSEITSPSPFPEGTPDTLITAPAPSSTLTLPATGGSTPAPSLPALRSISTLPSSEQGGHHNPGSSSPTMAPTGSIESQDGGGGIDSPDSGLSTAAAAGIGVGSTVGGVLLLILVGWFVQRRKRLAPTASRAYDRPLKDDPAGEAAEAGGGGGIEMSSKHHHNKNGQEGGAVAGAGGGGMAVKAEDRI